MAVRLFIGTRRGLFVATSDPSRSTWSISEPLLAGREVFHAFLDPRDGRTAWAATNHAVWGAHIHRSDDAGETWTVLERAPHHLDERGLAAIWALAPGHASEPDTLYAGIEPAGLFVSRDRGGSWSPVDVLNLHPTRGSWQPAGGGLALHSIEVDPRDPARIICALSAGGVYRTTDGGATWAASNDGVRAEFLPEQRPVSGHCVHKLRMHPLRSERLWQQNHCGVYRSDDGGGSWTEVTAGLPSEFGYVLALDPGDPDAAWVIPEASSHLRTVVDGRLRVYRTRNAGRSWSAATEGLPQEHAYVGVLREAMDSDGFDPLGIYFGTSSGHLFASVDGGDRWKLVTGYLPRILSVTAAAIR